MITINRLITEDKDILAVTDMLCKFHGIDTKQIDSKLYGGVDHILASFDTEIQSPDMMALAIVRDTDSNLASRWQSLRNTASICGYSNVPPIPNTSGTIIHDNRLPKLGIWLMPNNRLPGMVEDFAEQLIPNGDLLWPRAQLVVQEIPEAQRRFNRIIKAQIHTWLAWQEVPGRPLGQAITKRYFDANAPHAQQFVDWLRRLFELEAASQP